MSEKEAANKGFTHHGSYFGIPVWLAPENPDFPVITKWEPMEYVMSLFIYIECFIRELCDDEPSFQFKIIKEIKVK